MTIPFWCLLVAVLMPYLYTFVSSKGRVDQLKHFDNKNPRAQYTQLTGLPARAVAAQQNSWEALAVFAPAVLVNHLAGGDPTWSARLAIAWVLLRVVYGAFYLGNQATLRSSTWFLGLFCVAGLFYLAATAG